MFNTTPKGEKSFFDYRLGGATRYFNSAFGATAASTFAITANRLYALPFFCPVLFIMGQIDINVTTLAAGNVRLGIYEDNGKCAPGKLLLDAGTVDVSATGVKGVTVTKNLRGGKLYWLALVSDVAPTLRASVADSHLVSFFGLSSALSTALGAFYYKSFTYAALPDPFGNTLTVSTGSMPSIYLRKDNY